MSKLGFKSIALIIPLLSGFSLFANQQTEGIQLNNQSQNSNTLSQFTNFTFTFPEIELVDHRKQPQELHKLFRKDTNVVFAFFFSHCVSVCTTITLNLKSILPELPANTTIAMISIDPETDTPDLLQSYAKQHQINETNWYLLTGDYKKIVNLQKSFEAYRGNKMNHTTSLFVKKSDSNVITEIKNNFSDIPGFLTAG